MPKPNLPVINLRFESMKGLFNDSKKLFVNANGAKEIIQAVNFAKKMGVQEVIVGGKESYLVTDLLKANNVPVIITETQSLPYRRGTTTFTCPTNYLNYYRTRV